MRINDSNTLNTAKYRQPSIPGRDQHPKSESNINGGPPNICLHRHFRQHLQIDGPAHLLLLISQHEVKFRNITWKVFLDPFDGSIIAPSMKSWTLDIHDQLIRVFVEIGDVIAPFQMQV